MNRITLRLRYGRARNRRLSPKHVRVAREGESLPSVAVQAPSSSYGDGGAASGKRWKEAGLSAIGGSL